MCLISLIQVLVISVLTPILAGINSLVNWIAVKK